MARVRPAASSPASAEIISFDQAMLAACPPEVREDLVTEATMLADAFAPEGRAEQIEAMACDLDHGVRDLEMNRVRARKLAAALRTLKA